ncbi:uncharacterized protein ACLA_090100 [Aspergillus clavatus NRRL 1]|uniref:Uncharacterized protein n=1 Tax=Aspergillus clavatus (strain ATCC 1007 / CBS 513.65 / DSM 816 / NCTC 3887 / NRRL 1 / QM 1276 / 107) TaxID=344612 RepID=A1CEL8_ASPCL|nr:uncharacterized protein ACLA_090100 [Aspergillus clavatus NRRL 1]EAW11317.1 conserved hypothetical protein [Aspergillus clavatus NRRL 1]
MLDENLPTFFLKPGTQQKHLWTVFLCQHGNEPEPVYTLRYPDPASPTSRNRYGVALCDPFVPDVVYGEVLIIPQWTQPSLSAETIRQNGGVTPPPEPILPSEFTIHLYNPDQQVTVRYKHKTWNTPATWEFEMPQHTFRQPSSSTLDHALTDPATADTTPKLRFSWRKDSKLSKDLTCLLSGKTTNMPEGKAKSKEPDITLSIFQSLRELTLYEPNLYRVEMEDFKGLEVVLLLGAVTIRDVFFSSMKDAFRLARDASVQKPAASGLGNNTSAGNAPGATQRTAAPVEAAVPASDTLGRNKTPAPVRSPTDTPATRPTPAPTPQQRKEEEKRTKKLLEEEEKARRRRQAEIDKETRRLQKIYGREEQQVRASTTNLALPAPAQPPRPQVQQQPSQPHLPPRPNPRYYYHHQAVSISDVAPVPRPQAGPVPNRRPLSTVQFAPAQMAAARPQGPGPVAAKPQLQPKKSSFFGFRRTSEDANSKLMKKRSSMF